MLILLEKKYVQEEYFCCDHPFSECMLVIVLVLVYKRPLL